MVEGQQVKAGQVIVQMDDRVLRANRAELQAALDELKEHHKQAEYAVELATIDVDRLKELLPGQLAPAARSRWCRGSNWRRPS